MPDLKLLFLQMAVVLTSTQLTAVAFRFIGQPAVMGEMAAGILLGPSFLGSIFPAMMNRVFPVGGLGPLYALSQLGLVLFMFLVGLEVQPGSLRGSTKSVMAARPVSWCLSCSGEFSRGASIHVWAMERRDCRSCCF